jgi:hypothetical protein
MMKKVWLILLAVVLVFGLVMLGCSSDSGGDDTTTSTDDGDDTAEDTSVDLGAAAYQTGSGDTVGAESQAVWKIETAEVYALLVADGTKLVVTFENAIAGGLQMIWQAYDDTEESYGGWNQEKPIADSGDADATKGASLSDDKKTLTVDLSKGLKDYATASTGFKAATGTNKKAQIILAYYTGDTKMKGLKPLSAKLVGAE